MVTAEGRRVVQADIEASNGYLHLVDRVLLPPIGNLYHLLEMSDDLAVFKSLIDAAGLQSELTGEPIHSQLLWLSGTGGG